MRVKAAIEKKLGEGLKPQRLKVVDESHLHAGHAGARDGGESHFRVEIVASAFAGLNRVARQRLVYGLLSEELKGSIHALALRTLTPEEDRAS